MNTKILKLLATALILFLLSCSGEDKEFEKRAYKNLDKIQVGDDSLKVLKIMGKPMRVYSFLGEYDSSTICYDYGRVNDWDIDHSSITIYFNEEGKVSHKTNGEKR